MNEGGEREDSDGLKERQGTATIKGGRMKQKFHPTQLIGVGRGVPPQLTFKFRLAMLNAVAPTTSPLLRAASCARMMTSGDALGE